MSGTKSDAPFQLADWSVDPSSGTVTRADTSVRLEPKVMDVLLQLAARPGETLSKAELIDTVWADSFVGEAALSRCISELRRALGDDARNPRYIETLPKRGYRLLAHVGALPVLDGHGSSGAPRQHPRAWRSALVASAITAALLGTWWATPEQSNEPTGIESIAVLPLRALSEDAEQRFFAEGLTNQLITELAAVRTLRVVSGLAARRARGANAPLRSIASSLGVDAIVDGTVQQSARRTLVSLELAHGATDEIVWAGTYQEGPGDLLEIGQEVAGQAAREIGFAIAMRAGAPARQAVEVAGARQALDRGRRLATRGTPVDSVRSLEEFRRALSIDYEYAAAWAALAEVQAVLGWNNWSDPATAYAEARAAAYAALERDPRMAAAHAVLAAVAAELNQDWPEAERRFLTALQLEPRSSNVLERYSRHLRRLGRLGEALELSARAVEEDDGTIPILLSHALNSALSGAHDDALRLVQSALELDNDAGEAYSVLCTIRSLQERYEDALSACVRAAAMPGRDLDLGPVGYAYARAGQPERALSTLTELEGTGDATITALAAATIRLGLGETDAALALLELAAERRSLRLASILGDPYLRQLRNEPRFEALLAGMGISPDGDRDNASQ